MRPRLQAYATADEALAELARIRSQTAEQLTEVDAAKAEQLVMALRGELTSVTRAPTRTQTEVAAEHATELDRVTVARNWTPNAPTTTVSSSKHASKPTTNAPRSPASMPTSSPRC